MSVANTVSEIQTIADEILSTLGAVDPALQPATQLTEGVVGLLALLIGKGLTAYSEAAGVPITAETVAALMPNPAPLSEPTQ